MPPSLPDRAKPYRMAMISLFFVLALVPALLFFRSVVHEIFSHPAGPPVGPISVLARSACLDKSEALRRELADHFDGLRGVAESLGSGGLRRWQSFRLRWANKVDRAREACRETIGHDGPGMGLEARFNDLEELERIYGTQFSRLLGEDGDTLKETAERFKRTGPGASTTERVD